MKFCFCGNSQVDRAHIKSKGSGGTWDEDNIIHLCRNHHVEQHKLGWNRFAERYPAVAMILIEKGWEYDKYVKKWRKVKA